MHLQRIAVYRATRILSWVLPVVILVFVSIAGSNYWSRTRAARPFAPRTEALPPDLAVQTDGVRYVVSVGDRDQFLVIAKGMQVTKDNRSLLKGVEVLIYAQKPEEPNRRIRGDECVHEKETQKVLCEHNVSVELEQGTIAYTDHLSYEVLTGLISSNVETTLDRAGEMTGHSGKMDYFAKTGLMRLTENFQIDLTQGGGMRGGTAVFQYKEHWVTISQGVELTSTNGRIQGGNGRAELVPETYRPRQITVESGATAEAPSFTVNSDWLQSELSDDGAIEHVLGRGNVRAETKAAKTDKAPDAQGDDSLKGTLTGPEVEAWLEGGLLKTVEARQNPDFVGPSGSLKASETIRIEPGASKAGSLRTVRTEGISSFSRDGLSIDGRNFTIGFKGDEQAFNTSSRATLKSAGLTTVADITAAHFDTNTKSLKSMQQSGNVTFEEESGRTGAAEKLTVDDGGDRIELEDGSPWVKVSQGTLSSRKIELNRKTESFTGDGNVRMTSTGKGGNPVVIRAGHVQGTGARIDYTRQVQMFPGNGQVDADHVVVFPMDNHFEAEGNVYSRSSEVQVWAKTMEFNDLGENAQSAHYTGGVRTEKSDKNGPLELKTQDLKVHSKGGGPEVIVATGGVDMTQGRRRGHGDRMGYNVKTGESLLEGTKDSDAEVRDSDDSVKGCAIQIFADGRREVKPCADRSVISSFKPKN